MIIGNGIIAKAFSAYKNDQGLLIFASGVSNSTTDASAHFARERTLLLKSIKQEPKKRFVYFSTCSINDPSVNTNAYVNHKRDMEALIQTQAQQYLIVRLTNIIGEGGNRNTIINYLFEAVKNQVPIQLWEHAERNVLDQEDMVYIVSEILKTETKNQTINIASSENIKVLKVVAAIEKYLQKKAVYSLIDKGSPLQIDTVKITPYLKQIECKKGKGILYFETLLSKYYTK